MPFDGTNFPERRGPKSPPQGEKLLRIVFAVVAVMLLVTPISLGGITDLVRYFQHH
jgi:hypothetical protein